ncbi:neuron navigator 1-like isoform X2 [Brachyhypopomus gauderio]|uniref:neuron navigator 1-like isoform X2 n=1 Tax=Brachyhypopomus gauderio TaxID=698409 RepID=UPI00404393B5
MSGRVLNGKAVQLPAQRVEKTMHGLSSWDESSSTSSGFSDGSDKFRSEEFNADSSLNSLPNDSRSNSFMWRTDSEKHSLVKSGLAWYSEEVSAQCRGDRSFDTGSLKTASASMWKDANGTKSEVPKLQTLNHHPSLKKKHKPPLFITAPVTHNSQSMLKVPSVSKNDHNVEKAKMTVKSSGLQRSCSDAEKDHSENHKSISGFVQPSTGSSYSFGFKKPPTVTGTATVLTPSVSSVSGISTTMGKTSKSSSIPLKPPSVSSSNAKTSSDVSNSDQGVLAPNSCKNIRYRSLPRPSKPSTMNLPGNQSGARPVSSNIDGSLLSLKPVQIQSKLKELSGGCNRFSLGNQTDKEKEKAKAKMVVSKAECGENGELKNGSSTYTEIKVHPPSKLLGLRQSYSRGKYSDLPYPSSQRPSSAKSQSKPIHLVQHNSNSLHCHIVNMKEHFPPKVLSCSNVLDRSSIASGLTPSPVPTLSVNSLDCFSGSTGEQETLPGSSPVFCPRVRAKHEEKSLGNSRSSGNKVSLTPIADSLVQYDSSQSDDIEGCDSHTIMNMTEVESPSSLPSPSQKIPPIRSVAHPGTCIPQMTRSNSIPIHDSDCDLYQTLLGSTLSLTERPKSMIHSGSFMDKEPGDDVHGSVISLTSSASSSYSSQIRKLRRELESSQEKVASLTSQLSANANLVAAFEQSLTMMTNRLQTLSASAEQKDSELMELRDTIEHLKMKNTEAQDVIQGALNKPDVTAKELRIKRQNSSESISSLNSISSHSSMSSLKGDAKKKKKKNWLRSSLGKAFTIKKGTKADALYSDTEETATPEDSVPSNQAHEREEPMPLQTTSFSAISEGQEEHESGEKVVSELRSELLEKEMKLTDIRLEALNSAHQLEQLKGVMNRMQLTVENLKAENDQLKIDAPSSLLLHCGPPISSLSQPYGPPTVLRSNQLKLTKSLSFSLYECSVPNFASMKAMNLSCQSDEVRLRVLVHITDKKLSGEVKKQDFYIGSVLINSRTDWVTLDKFIIAAFQDYISKVDPSSSMGLSVDSIYSYNVNQSRRFLGSESPASPPCECLNKGSGLITVTLKGFNEKSVDSLVFETLIPKSMMQHYISLLIKHRRLILSGPSGTGKTHLTYCLANYLLERSGHEAEHGHVITFNMHQQTSKELQLYLSNLANQIEHDSNAEDIPLVIVLDDVNDASSISELVHSTLTCKYYKCPFIIGTTNQPVKISPNHGLHLSFRMVTFSNNVEPINGFLLRYLHRKLIEAEREILICEGQMMKVLDWVSKLWYHLHTFLEKYGTADFLIGPCFFLSCPVTIEEFRSWFIDLWNQSIIPYLQEGAKDGMKVHGKKDAWEDPVEWVRDTLPWPSAQQDQVKLSHLPPPTAGPNTMFSQPSNDRSTKDTQFPPMESDPLMTMLLKLQDYANYTESPESDISGVPNFETPQ